ncbi:YadA C-terminal domain-containing protein, partial [Vibrio tubiashii]
SLFSGTALAQNIKVDGGAIYTSDIEKIATEIGATNGSTITIKKDGTVIDGMKEVGYVTKTDNGVAFIQKDGKTSISYNEKTNEIIHSKVEGEGENTKVRNHHYDVRNDTNQIIIDDHKNIDPVDPNKNRKIDASTASKVINGAGMVKHGNHWVATKGEFKDYKIDNESGYVYDDKGRKVSKVSVDENGSVTIDPVDRIKPDDSSKINGDKGKNGVMEDTAEIMDAVDEQIAINERNEANAQTAYDWARQAEAEFKQEVARLDSKIDTMEGRVSNGTAMVGAMSQMQFGHSGLGVGAGVAEFNGSKAVAVGVGYAFGAEKQWMAKGSFGYAESKKGKGSKDTMAAAGLTYSFK